MISAEQSSDKDLGETAEHSSDQDWISFAEQSADEDSDNASADSFFGVNFRHSFFDEDLDETSDEDSEDASADSSSDIDSNDSSTEPIFGEDSDETTDEDSDETTDEDSDETSDEDSDDASFCSFIDMDSDGSFAELSSDTDSVESWETCRSWSEVSYGFWNEEIDVSYIPTLQQLCLIKIAFAICNEPDVKTFTPNIEHMLLNFSGADKSIEKNPFCPRGVNSLRNFRKYMWASVAKEHKYSIFENFTRKRYFKIPPFSYAPRYVLPKTISKIVVFLRVKWEKLIQMKMSCLGLPKYLQNNLAAVIIGIFWVIYRYTKFKKLPTEEEFHSNLCWRRDGEIDFEETAELLFQHLPPPRPRVTLKGLQRQLL